MATFTATGGVRFTDTEDRVSFTAGYASVPSSAGGSTDTTFIVTADPFNAVGDGVADDTAALEDAIAAAIAAGGGIVHLPVGTYKIRRTLFLGPNVVLQGEGFGSVITKPDTVTANLTVNSNAGTSTVTIADTAAFAVGDAVTVSDTTSYEWLSTQTTVASKTSTVLTLDQTLDGTVQTGRSARVFTSFPLVSNVADGDTGIVVRNLTLDQNAGDNDPSDEFTIGTVHWVGAYGALVDGVQFLNACGDAYSDQSQDGTGLNVTYPQAASIRRSTRNTITNCRIIAPGRHGVHLGTAQDGAIVTGNEIRDISNTLGMALFFCAYSTNATIDGNLVSNCTRGFDGGDNRDTGNIISNNVFQGGTNSTQAAGALYAITAGGQSVITGNQILDWAGGIRISADCTDCIVADNYVRIVGAREALSILANADRCSVTGNTFTGGTAGSKPVLIVSADDCHFVGNLTFGGYQGWVIQGCNRLRIIGSPIVSATVATGFTLNGTASTDVEIDVRGTVQASAVITETTAAARLVVNGVGTNGATDPASGGAWSLNPATAANRKWHGVEVHWNDGSDHVSKYQHGVGWIELTGGAGGGTPDAHAASHENGGSDELALDGSQITTGTVAAARLGSGTPSASNYLRGDGSWQAVSGGSTMWDVVHDETLGVATSTFSVDLTGYNLIEVILTGYGDNSTSTVGMRVRFNSDGGNNYLNNTGAATSAWNAVGSMPGSLTNTDRRGLWRAEITLGHTSGDTTAVYRSAYRASDSATGTTAVQGAAYYTNKSAAITAMTIYPSAGNWEAGTRLVVLGRP